MSQVEFQAREPNNEKKKYAAYCVVQTAKSEIKKPVPETEFFLYLYRRLKIIHVRFTTWNMSLLLNFYLKEKLLCAEFHYLSKNIILSHLTEMLSVHKSLNQNTRAAIKEEKNTNKKITWKSGQQQHWK